MLLSGQTPKEMKLGDVGLWQISFVATHKSECVCFCFWGEAFLNWEKHLLFPLLKHLHLQWVLWRENHKKKIKQNSQCNLLSSFINFLNCKKVCVFLGRCLPCRARLWTHLVTHTFENFSYSPVISVCYTRPKGGLTWSVPGVCKPKEKH